MTEAYRKAKRNVDDAERLMRRARVVRDVDHCQIVTAPGDPSAGVLERAGEIIGHWHVHRGCLYTDGQAFGYEVQRAILDMCAELSPLVREEVAA